MAITSNSYTGNGSTTLYSFTFPYLDTADVKVSLNGTVTTAYTFANATTIQFNTAPGAGVAIRIYRETDDSTLEAVFSPGSSIRASDLNSDFDQLLYLGQESNNIAESATTTANTALTTANTAISTANAATSTANTALSNSAAAVSTANTASSNASAAVSTANTASSNATTAVNTANAATVTANSAASTAATALSTANTASSNASAAVSTANTASTNASNAVTTANTALSTANTASSNASTAVTTANNAVSTANGAASTASTALTTANAAISAVASAVIYTPVANLTALAALTPSNGDYFELTDSTGAEGSALITGVTVGLVGAPGLTFRLRYDAPPGIFTFLGYFANDSETRYLKLSGGTLTGQLRGDDNTSASTPGFAFDGDPNTGIGRPGADELALITGGTARLTIDPAGAVAVAGSLSQGGNAVVVTTDSRLSDTRVPTDGSVTNTKVAAAAAIDGTKISPNFGSQNVVTTGTVSGASLIPTSSSVPTNGVYLNGANSVAISTNGSGRLFVNSSGSVGIGTSSPSSTLNVVAQSDTAGGDGITLGNSTGNRKWLTRFGTNTNLGLYQDFWDGATWNTRLALTYTGNLGIGTATPVQPLEVVTATGGGIALRPSAGNATQGLLWYDTGGGPYGFVKYDHQLSALSFGTNNTERARIDSSGRLLVGTSTGLINARLTVSGGDTNAGGTIEIRNDRANPSGEIYTNHNIGGIEYRNNSNQGYASIYCYAESNTSASNSAGRLVFATTAPGASSPTERLYINSVGEHFFRGTNTVQYVLSNQGAGTSSALFWGGHSATSITAGTGSYRVYTNGNVVNTNNSYGALSDIKLKENIVDAASQWEDLKALQVRKYNFREETGHEVHTQIGLIAQEVELVSPGLVYESPDRDADGNDLGTVTKSVNYSVLYMKAVKALQEAMERIETLEANAADMKTELNELKAKMP